MFLSYKIFIDLAFIGSRNRILRQVLLRAREQELSPHWALKNHETPSMRTRDQSLSPSVIRYGKKTIRLVLVVFFLKKKDGD